MNAMSETDQQVGEQELAVFRFIHDRSPIAARDVAEQFARSHGLSRSTILTVIERLRKKGFLNRKRHDGVYLYEPRVAQAEVLQRLVRTFVESTLGGSVSPVMLYLANTRQINDDELVELQKIVDELRAIKEGS
jgi:predicted transcriptional regulator